jgi:hypothetical protein
MLLSTDLGGDNGSFHEELSTFSCIYSDCFVMVSLRYC